MTTQLFATTVPWDEVYAALGVLGWPIRELSERLGLTSRTITKWRQRGVAPQYAIAYLEQILLIMEIRNRLHEDVKARG